MIINSYRYAGFTSNYSLNFDGVNERLGCAAIPTISATQNFSVSFWVKLSATGSHSIFGSFTTGTNSVQINCNETSQLWSMAVRDGDTTYDQFADTIVVDQWYHVCGVYDGTEGTASNRCRLYIDGVSLTRTGGYGTNPSTSGTATDTTSFGQTGTYAAYSNSEIDEAGIYDYSLTASNVTTLYNSGVPNDLMDNGITAPAHYWRMGEDATWNSGTGIWTIPNLANAGYPGNSVNMEELDRTTDTP